MGAYITDFIVVALLVIGITAIMGIIVSEIGEKVFGGKHRSEYVDKGASIQTGWKMVGGRKK